MRHKLMIAVLVATAVSASPRVAAADQCNVDAVIENCDRAIPMTSLLAEPLRGWCYLFGLGNCAASW